MKPKMKEERSSSALWCWCFLCLMFAVYLLPNQERFFPLSRYAMFANKRPALEPLPYLIIQRIGGQQEPVDILLWSSGNLSNGRNFLQALPGKSNLERARGCAFIARMISKHNSMRDAAMVHIYGGQFRRSDVFKNPVQPVSSQLIYSCSIPPTER